MPIFQAVSLLRSYHISVFRGKVFYFFVFLVLHKNCFIFSISPTSNLGRFWTAWQDCTFGDNKYHQKRGRMVWVESLHRGGSRAIGNKLWENRHLNQSATVTFFFSSGLVAFLAERLQLFSYGKKAPWHSAYLFCLDFRNKLCCFF